MCDESLREWSAKLGQTYATFQNTRRVGIISRANCKISKFLTVKCFQSIQKISFRANRIEYTNAHFAFFLRNYSNSVWYSSIFWLYCKNQITDFVYFETLSSYLSRTEATAAIWQFWPSRQPCTVPSCCN